MSSTLRTYLELLGRDLVQGCQQLLVSFQLQVSNNHMAGRLRLMQHLCCYLVYASIASECW